MRVLKLSRVYVIENIDIGIFRLGLSSHVLSERHLMSRKSGCVMELVYSSCFLRGGEVLLGKLVNRYHDNSLGDGWFSGLEGLDDFMGKLLSRHRDHWFDLGEGFGEVEGIDEEDLVLRLLAGYEGGLSISSMSKTFGINRITLRSCLDVHGLLGVDRGSIVKGDVVPVVVKESLVKGGSRLDIGSMVAAQKAKNNRG